MTDSAGRLAGAVGLRDLAGATTSSAASRSAPRPRRPRIPPSSILSRLTDGLAHAVMIVDDDRRSWDSSASPNLLAALTPVPPVPGVRRSPAELKERPSGRLPWPDRSHETTVGQVAPSIIVRFRW